MVICLGPICIPLWGLMPLILVFFRNLWERIKRWW